MDVDPAPAGRLTAAAHRLTEPLPPLLVAAERVANTVALGIHGRRRVGVGETFWQFRAYMPGDTIGRIDWRQTAKRDTPFVRELEWEASQTVHLWRADGPGMGYASARAAGSKRARADLLLMALAILLDRAGERVALLDGENPPATGRSNLMRLAAGLAAPIADRPHDLPTVRPRLPAHGAVVLAGDFLAPLPEIEAALAGLAARRQRVHVIHLLDPAELALPFRGRIRFHGLGRMAGTDTLIPRVDSVRPLYRERFEAHCAGLAALCRGLGFRLARHTTDQPVESALMGLAQGLAAR